MADGPLRIYWDANVFLAYLLAIPEHLAVLQAIVRLARDRRDVAIVTSAVSITEVAYFEAERVSGALDPAVERRLDALWLDPALRVEPFTTVVGRSARRLIRDSIVAGPRLRPLDAIHLATAMESRVSEFQTFDTALHKHSGRLGFPIGTPMLPDAQPNEETAER